MVPYDGSAYLSELDGVEQFRKFLQIMLFKAAKLDISPTPYAFPTLQLALIYYPSRGYLSHKKEWWKNHQSTTHHLSFL